MVAALRRKVPDIALSSDFIVGFPGESDGDFADTLRLVTEVNYAQAYSFKYSPRPGTPAAASDSQVAEDVRRQSAWRCCKSYLNAQQLAFNHRMPEPSPSRTLRSSRPPAGANRRTQPLYAGRSRPGSRTSLCTAL